LDRAQVWLIYGDVFQKVLGEYCYLALDIAGDGTLLAFRSGMVNWP